MKKILYLAAALIAVAACGREPAVTEKPLPYTLVFGNKQFQADGKAYLLIESRESIWLNRIDFDYYH